MALFVVVGAGPVGREVARLLVAEGHSVRLISRTGMGIPGDGVENVHLDARDGEALARISSSAEAIFMCAMAPYTRWPTDFPPIMDGVLTAAKRVGARLLIAGNVYGYGEQARSTLTPDLPLAPTSIKGRVRVAMWRSARFFRRSGSSKCAPATILAKAPDRSLLSPVCRHCLRETKWYCRATWKSLMPGLSPRMWLARSWRHRGILATGEEPFTCRRGTFRYGVSCIVSQYLSASLCRICDPSVSGRSVFSPKRTNSCGRSERYIISWRSHISSTPRIRSGYLAS